MRYVGGGVMVSRNYDETKPLPRDSRLCPTNRSYTKWNVNEHSVLNPLLDEERIRMGNQTTSSNFVIEHSQSMYRANLGDPTDHFILFRTMRNHDKNNIQNCDEIFIVIEEEFLDDNTSELITQAFLDVQNLIRKFLNNKEFKVTKIIRQQGIDMCAMELFVEHGTKAEKFKPRKSPYAIFELSRLENYNLRAQMNENMTEQILQKFSSSPRYITSFLLTEFEDTRIDQNEEIDISDEDILSNYGDESIFFLEPKEESSLTLGYFVNYVLMFTKLLLSSNNINLDHKIGAHELPQNISQKNISEKISTFSHEYFLACKHTIKSKQLELRRETKQPISSMIQTIFPFIDDIAMKHNNGDPILPVAKIINTYGDFLKHGDERNSLEFRKSVESMVSTLFAMIEQALKERNENDSRRYKELSKENSEHFQDDELAEQIIHDLIIEMERSNTLFHFRNFSIPYPKLASVFTIFFGNSEFLKKKIGKKRMFPIYQRDSNDYLLKPFHQFGGNLAHLNQEGVTRDEEYHAKGWNIREFALFCKQNKIRKVLDAIKSLVEPNNMTNESEQLTDTEFNADTRKYICELFGLKFLEDSI